MIKVKLALVFFIAFASAATAQYGYNKGDKLLNIGVGVNSYYNGGIPLGISFESGISDVISVGAGVDYLSNKYDIGSGSSYKFTAFYFGARASYHFNELFKLSSEQVDLYAGATAGYRSFTWKDSYSSGSLSSSYGNGIFVGGYIGGKYYFTEGIGAFAEVGATGSTNAKVGLAFRF